jgi:hypothetical protein
MKAPVVKDGVEEEPYPPSTVKKLLLEILKSETLSFSGHAYEEMAKDKLDEVDIVNVLRGGTARAGEFRDGTWRYQVHTSFICGVVAFRAESHAVVVTAWRIKKK